MFAVRSAQGYGYVLPNLRCDQWDQKNVEPSCVRDNDHPLPAVRHAIDIAVRYESGINVRPLLEFGALWQTRNTSTLGLYSFYLSLQTNSINFLRP